MLPIKISYAQVAHFDTQDKPIVTAHGSTDLEWSPTPEFKDKMWMVVHDMLNCFDGSNVVTSTMEKDYCEYRIRIYNATVPDCLNEPRALLFEGATFDDACPKEFHRIFYALLENEAIIRDVDQASYTYQRENRSKKKKGSPGHDKYRTTVMETANLKRKLKRRKWELYASMTEYLAWRANYGLNKKHK